MPNSVEFHDRFSIWACVRITWQNCGQAQSTHFVDVFLSDSSFISQFMINNPKLHEFYLTFKCDEVDCKADHSNLAV
jgi:hypothetical protein